MNPGPATSADATSSSAAICSAYSCASSRGGRPTVLAERSATFVAKSPWDGSFGRSSSICSPSASPMRAARRSTALGNDFPWLEHPLELPDLLRRADADDHVAHLEQRVLGRADVEPAAVLADRDDVRAGLLRPRRARRSSGRRRRTLDFTSISSKLISGWSLDVRLFRNDATCGLIISCAITRPAVAYGVTTRSAPASLQLPLGLLGRGARDHRQVRPARLGRERDVHVVAVVVRRDQDPARAVDPGANEVLVLGSAALDEEIAELLGRRAVASELKSSTTYGTPAWRSSSAARRPTRP